MAFAAGQRWTYAPPQGFEGSRIVIGAVLNFTGGVRVVCAAVAGAPVMTDDGTQQPATIAFLPFAEEAFAATVIARDGEDVPPAAFQAEMDAWLADPRGLTMFTVPFDGSLKRLIARQMEKIATGA